MIQQLPLGVRRENPNHVPFLQCNFDPATEKVRKTNKALMRAVIFCVTVGCLCCSRARFSKHFLLEVGYVPRPILLYVPLFRKTFVVDLRSSAPLRVSID